MRNGGNATPWRKSRTFGDVYGGRSRRRVTDGIFQRLHSIDPPSTLDELPIVIADNPSRDFVFPATADQLVQRLRQLPAKDTAGITHLWLRRTPTPNVGDPPTFGEFICGSGVRLIVIYAWPKDLTLDLGKRRPSRSTLHQYERWTTDLRFRAGTWWLTWTPEQLRSWCLDHLLLHEVGHHLDWYRRHWSPPRSREIEAAADSYAAQWTAHGMATTEMRRNGLALSGHDREP